MKREILFRGKRADNGEWVEGYYVNKSPEKHQIVTKKDIFPIQVLPETIGQFAGLTDKNGVKIFEGDLLRTPPCSAWENLNYSCFEVFFHSGDENSDYNTGYSISRMHNYGAVCGGYIPSFKPKTVSNMIIIGNIYDNRELIQS